MSAYPYEMSQPPPHGRDKLEERARKIALSEGRTEVTLLDRLRAQRELERGSLSPRGGGA